MLAHLRPAVVLLAVFTLLTGIAYPLSVTGLAQLVMPFQANGSLIVRGGHAIGSALIGQSFTADRYVHGRASATVGPDPANASKAIVKPYNAAGSGGSNLGPTSKALVARVATDVAALREAGALAIPADAVTASASGLDPHISPAFAALQVPRIARVRHLPESAVRSVLDAHTRRPLLGLVGEPRVNVLQLNLALDAAHAPGT